MLACEANHLHAAEVPSGTMFPALGWEIKAEGASMLELFRIHSLKAAALVMALSLAACGEPEPDATSSEDTSAYPAGNVIETPEGAESAEEDRDPTPQTSTGGGIPSTAPGQ